MKKILLTSFFSFSFLILPTFITAQVFMTASSNGTQQTSFLSNETMYIVANNITNVSTTVNIFLIDHNASLANLTILGAKLGPLSIQTNSSGGFAVQILWSPNLIPGTYDLIADVNRNNIFDFAGCGAGGDCNYSAGGNGIVVTRAPIPTLVFSIGPKSPSSHSYTYDSNNLNNLMLQIKIVGDQVEPVQISSLDFVPSGSGDDKTGVSIVKMFDDSNNNGLVDQGEALLSYGQYLSDDGVLRFDLSSSYLIQSNSSVYLLVQYTMTNSVSSSQTFSTQLVSVTAAGQNTKGKAVVSGLPVNSGVKTISGGTTTTTTTITTTTTTLPKDLCSKDSDCGSSSCSNGKQVSPVCKTDLEKGIKVCSSTSTNVGCCPGEKCGFDFSNIYFLLAVGVAAFLLPAVYFLFIKKSKTQPELYSGH